MSHRMRLSVGSAIIILITGYVIYVAQASSWRYYLTVDECIASPNSLVNQPVRVSGRVAPYSLVIAANRQSGSFTLAGAHHQLAVDSPVRLPDNLAEGIEVVVEGRFRTSKQLCAEQVLTRCSSKYSAEAAATPSPPQPRKARP